MGNMLNILRGQTGFIYTNKMNMAKISMNVEWLYIY